MKANGTAVGIWASAAIAFPMVNLFQQLSTSELMMVRGGTTMVITLGLFGRRISWAGRSILIFSTLFGFAALSFYSGIRAWGINPTAVVLTVTPIVNIAAKKWRGKTIDTYVYVSLTVLLVGVAIALNPWQTVFNAAGFTWSVAAILLAGVGLEVLAGTTGVDPYSRTFWLALVMFAIGATVTAYDGTLPFHAMTWTTREAGQLAGFGILGGFVYFLSYIIAFDKLKTEVASVLAMGETPAVIVSAQLLLGEHLSGTQWSGVVIALSATTFLSIQEARASQRKS